MKNTKYHRKISETFLDFSSPRIDSIGSSPTTAQVEKVLQITYTVWNSLVLDSVKNTTEHIDNLRKIIADDPETSILIEHFISRKKSMFGNDLRFIGEYSLIRKNGEWRLRADVRDPLTFS